MKKNHLPQEGIYIAAVSDLAAVESTVKALEANQDPKEPGAPTSLWNKGTSRGWQHCDDAADRYGVVVDMSKINPKGDASSCLFTPAEGLNPIDA